MTAPLYASANGIRITSGSLAFPFFGLWAADIALSSAQLLTNPVTIVLANLTLIGAVCPRQRPFAGNNTVRLVGGFGGWGKPVTLPPYQNPAGVPLSTVLRDVAGQVGEKVKLAVDASVGAFYVPEVRAPAQRVLRHLAGEIWWVDRLGVTQVGPRPAPTIKTPAEVTHYAGGKGWLSVATEDLASWQPGAMFAGPTVPVPIRVGMARIATDNGGTLRLEVLTT